MIHSLLVELISEGAHLIFDPLLPVLLEARGPSWNKQFEVPNQRSAYFPFDGLQSLISRFTVSFKRHKDRPIWESQSQ